MGLNYCFLGCWMLKSEGMAEAAKSKPVIGLSWEPKLPPLPSGTKKGSDKPPRTLPESSSSSAVVYKSNTKLIDGLFVPPNNPKKLNKLLRKQFKDTAGKNWFDMTAQTLTPELKKDLQLLKGSLSSRQKLFFLHFKESTKEFLQIPFNQNPKLRSVIDPKRHYKKGDSKSRTVPMYFQVGTVIESASDFFTGRLTKKERKATLADELLSDHTLGEYRKRKVREIEEQNRPGGVEKWKIKGGQSWKRAKQRRR
ncbi:unnamed protein product [Camellia sinensis]